MNTIIYHMYYLESQFVGFPLVIRVTIFLITVLAIIYLASILRIFLLARTRTRIDNREKQIEKKYEKKLSSILFSEQNIPIGEIKKDLGLINNNLKEWEKAYVTKLMMKLIKQNEKIELDAS